MYSSEEEDDDASCLHCKYDSLSGSVS
eukprot:COSAG01_NODE_11043_length_2022_cov_1.841394_1_plen_26_part_10